MKQEVKSMNRTMKAGVPTPAVYLVDMEERKIYMEYLGLSAMTLKSFIREFNDLTHPVYSKIVEKIATNLAEMHFADIIHGDLTTSNMMLKSSIKPFQMS